MKYKELIGKNCELTFLSNFVLNGTVDDVNEAGILFTTTQQSSFVNFSEIKKLMVLED